jgi:hypothetical protein
MRNRNLSNAAALLVALTLAALPTLAGEGQSYGEPLTGDETIKISELLSDPDPYVGETVRVEGLVTGVCKKRGCWISLASDKEFEELRIKAEDGVIVFPMEAKGHRAVAEGVFTKIEMSMEQTLQYKQHHAEEHGEEFDPASVTEPEVWYQIDVSGAVVY